jgi:FkbM family methyltransferase
VPVTREDVRAAYRMILGREPENDQVIDARLHFPDVMALGEDFLRSGEFCARRSWGFPTSKWVAVDVLDRFVQWIDLHDSFVSQGCLNNNWEPSETSYFTSQLSQGAVVIDVGANIGWFSLVAAKHIGPNGIVHAFEPRPETGHALKRTICDNRLQSIVHVWPYALSDRTEKLNLVWALNTDNPGGSSFGEEASAGAGHESAPVLALPLDELLPDIAPDIVKIDVEGAEPRAIRGMVNALSRKHPPILSELHVRQLEVVSNASPSDYIALLGSLGYGCYLLEDGRPTTRLHDLPAHCEGLASVVFEWQAGG